MHTAPSLVKSATQPTYVNTPMGRWVEDIVRNRIQNKPLSTVYDTQAASMTPEQRAPYDLLVRNRQSQAAGQLTDLLQYGLAAGGVYGLAKGIPLGEERGSGFRAKDGHRGTALHLRDREGPPLG